MLLKSKEINTGGGSLVTVIECDQWNYILVVSDESAAAYDNEEAFWDGLDALAFSHHEM